MVPDAEYQKALDHIAAMKAELARVTASHQAAIARAKAEAFSNAADTACNQWNSLPHHRASWIRMTPAFQEIWENLKAISHDHHTYAAHLSSGE